MKTRLCLVSLLACMGGLSSHGAEPATPGQLQLRQRIIRAPEEEVVNALEKKPDDDALAKKLLQWVESGRARVISDLTVPANPKVRFEAKEGKVYKWVTENRQHYRTPVLTPESWEDVFLGIKLEGANRTEPWPENPPVHIPGNPFFDSPAKPEEIPGGKHALTFSFHTETRAQMASKVKWPLVWPESEKPEVGTYEQDDFLVQDLITTAVLEPGRDNVVAFLRPATDLETEPATRELDVVLMRASPDKASAASAPDAKPIFPAPPRVHLFGFGINDRQAVELLASRKPNDDASLLAKLQSMAHEGKAIRRLVCGSQVSSNQITLASVREHSYPTEMPTIPSAWSERPVGTYVQMDLIGRELTLSLEQHPARFRWAEWACALDAPELIMRQPQFFSQRVRTNFLFPKDNVVLVTAMRTPECLKGSDRGPVIGETLLLFAELDQPQGRPPLKSWSSGPPPVCADLEALVFDLPAAELDAWKSTNTEQPVDDEERYQLALSKLKDGTATLVCHLAAVTHSGVRANVHTVEETLSVVEYHPVDHNPTGRYRPTGLEMRPVGSMWELDPGDWNSESFADTTPVISLSHALHHDVLPAVQPDLKASLKHAHEHDHQLLKPTFTTDEWKGSMNLFSGKARCLGPVRPKAAPFQDRIHVAFVRAVVRK